MQSQVQSTVVETVLSETEPILETDLPQGKGGTAGIVLGLLLIFVAILIGTASLVRARRLGDLARDRCQSHRGHIGA